MYNELIMHSFFMNELCIMSYKDLALEVLWTRIRCGGCSSVRKTHTRICNQHGYGSGSDWTHVCARLRT